LAACPRDERLRRVYGIGAKRGNTSGATRAAARAQASFGHRAAQHGLCQNALSGARAGKMMFLQ
jgi:hypothetical protein